MMSWLAANMPAATMKDIIGAQDLPSAKVINQQTFPYLLGTLAYKVVVKGGKYSETPDALRHKATLEITGDMFGKGGLSITKSLLELSGKRLTLSYIPATASDENLVTQYGGDMLKVPPYLLNVKPVIKIDGVNAAIGGNVAMGTNQMLTVSINAPNMSQDIAQHNIVVGQYSAVTIHSGKTPVEVVATRMEQLINNSKNVNAVTLDDLLGELLSNMGLAYFHHMTFEDDLYAKNFQMAYAKLASEALTAHGLDVTYIFGVPGSVAEGGMNIDADISSYAAQSLSGDKNRTKDFMNLSGMSGSAWEHKIFEMFFQTQSVSAIKLLKYASQQGVPIYTIDSTNIGQVLPILQVSQEVTTDVQNAVNAGKKVIIHQKELQYYSWKGAGYVILDLVTGVGGYMISGGLAGGGTSQPITGLNQNQSYLNPGGNPACGSEWNEPYVPEGIGNYNFTDACQRHDDCYGACGSFKLSCDTTLFVDMVNVCSQIQWSEPPMDSLGCVEAAYIYLYFVLSPLGMSAFYNAQQGCP